MKGRTATADEIKARWAFSEVRSDRFGGPYRTSLPQQLYSDIISGCTFDAIQPSHWSRLIQGLDAARGTFKDNVDAHKSNGYECVEWSAADLLNAEVIPYFGTRLYYRQFITMFPMSRPSGVLDFSDPRFKAWSVPVLDPPFVQIEPLISIRGTAGYMLLEGYTRSILWLRSGASSLLMWVPK